MEPVDISVILVLRDRAETVPTTLAHLEQQTLPAARFEIVAVDHGSVDGTLGVLERYAIGAPVRFQVLDANPGNFARARNLATDRARGKWLVFLDQDVLASPNLLDRYMREFETEPTHPFLLGRVALHPQIPPHVLTRRFIDDDTSRTLDPEKLHPTDWHGYNFGMSRALLRDQGGFDEQMRGPEFLEVALAHRLSERGVHGRLAQKAVVYEWQKAEFDAERARCYARGHAFHALEHGIGEPGATPLRPATIPAWAPHRFMMPFYVRACHDAEGDLRYAGGLFRRVLQHDQQRGYSDARKGRLRRG